MPASQYDTAQWHLDRHHPSTTIVFHEHLGPTAFYASIHRITNDAKSRVDVFVRTNLNNVLKLQPGRSIDVSSSKIEVFVSPGRASLQISGTYQLLCCALAQSIGDHPPQAHEDGGS
jgi:hypothetical protein